MLEDNGRRKKRRETDARVSSINALLYLCKFGTSINQKLGSKRNWKAANFRTSDRSFLGRLTVKRSLMQSHIRLMILNKESLAVAGILREVMERHTPNVFSAVKL